MKRTSLILLTLIFASAALAAEPQRYLVGTKRPLHSIMPSIKQIVGEDLTERTVVPFASFTGFAAELTEDEVAALQQSSDVRWVEPVLERHKFAQERHPLRQTVPLGLQAIFAPQTQNSTVAKGTINVAVIDTGIDYRHPDLAAAYAGGRNVIKDNDDPLDDDGHGTHVSGTLAASNNDIGVLGVAPKVRLWSVKMLDGQGNGTSEGLLKAVDWVVAKKEELGGNWIINLSLGSTEESLGEREAFQRVADKGILVIAASGNLSTQNIPSRVAFPAAYPSVVGVSATTWDKKHAYFSGQGPELDLCAPGVDVLSTLPVGTNEIAFVADGLDATFVNELTGSKRGVISAEFVYCSTGKVGDFPSNVVGKIALIQRGDSISFADKTRRAKQAGAIGVAIFDNVEVPQPGSWTLFNNDEDRAFDWPLAVRLTMQTGQELVAKGSHVITIAYTFDDYGENSGTSMASPHVAGAAALVWSLAPDATADQVRNALIATAVDLGTIGPDSLFGSGFVNVYAAARMLAPSAFGGITTGRPVGMRGRR